MRHMKLMLISVAVVAAVALVALRLIVGPVHIYVHDQVWFVL